MKEDKLYNIALGLVPGVGAVLSRHLLSYCGSAKGVFDSSYAKLTKIPGIGTTLANAILKSDALIRAEEEMKLADKNNVSLFFYTDKEYPERLKQVDDAPPLIYFQGNANLNATKIVSIVGTRQATSYGRDTTESLVEQLSKYQCLIISGLAYGIDIAAHKAALKYNLPTVGIMASGIDIIYPAVHKQTAKQMLEQGGLISENPFGSKPDAPQFPARNRIIAAMCDALIVVEANSKGGALITAEIANSYNKDVFAVPGNINEKTSEGCNNLIKNHKAALITSIEDLEKHMNWDLIKPAKQLSLNLFEQAALSDNEKKVIDILKEKNELMIDELSWTSGIQASQLASVLLQLEFQGIVKAMPGKRFCLAKR